MVVRPNDVHCKSVEGCGLPGVDTACQTNTCEVCSVAVAVSEITRDEPFLLFLLY